MKQDRYIGIFGEGKEKYKITVYCSGAIQAFFLLTADAIKLGKHYQLKMIICDSHPQKNIYYIDDILKVSSLIKECEYISES